MEFGELSDNPFSLSKTPARPARSAFVSAVKFLLLVAVCLGATIVIGSQGRGWLVNRLTSNFASLGTEEKQSRLTQIAGLGLPGIDPLVRAMADKDPQVARTAYELLQSAQNQWTVFRRSDQEQYHHALIDSLKGIAVHLPDDRTGWGTSLLQQTVLATVNRRDDSSRKLYRSANHALEMLAISDRAGPSVLSDQPIDSDEPRRLTVKTRPLPVSEQDQSQNWTDWPPANSTPSVHLEREAKITARSSTSEAARPDNAASVYRSGGAIKLQPTKVEEPVILRDFDQAKETSYQAKPIQSVAHVVDSPLETLDDQSVMKWLGSPHTAMRQKARDELQSRGFGETEMTIATQIAAGDVPTRLAMIDAISRSGQIDPRPWLFMLLGDDNRQVKLRAISVLATMKDAYVDQRLQKQLAEEPDTTVASQIRRVLELR